MEERKLHVFENKNAQERIFAQERWSKKLWVLRNMERHD
jgi:hypothetical protein